MRCGEHGAHQSPLAGKVAFDLETFGFRNHPVDGDEFSDLTGRKLTIGLPTSPIPAIELHSLWPIIGIIRPPVLRSNLYGIQPGVRTILVIDGDLVQVPVVVILSDGIINRVNPTIQVSDPVVVLPVPGE